ncbi:MAG TPA: TIR domain-containing protein, partial [Thermoanaerobaculia bacterium]|nr:TIR domain-containing protein [Thermoanaerobaculia bacterium]
MASIFLSYCRRNVVEAAELQRRLVQRGHEVWRDEAELPEASLWRAEITTAMERSEVFLCAVTQESLRSLECWREFELARALPKRIIPVVLDQTEPSAAPEELADINWIRLRDERALDRIDRAIRTDLSHLQQHTRFFLGAREWERDRGAVLRGANLREAMQWLSAAEGKEPQPTALHRQLVSASVKAQRRRRIGLALAAAVFVAAGIGLFFAVRRSRIDQRRSLANQLAGESLALWKAKNYDKAALWAVAAYQAAPTSSAVRALLNAAADQPQLAVTLHGHHQEVEALAFDPRGGRILSAGEEDDGIHIFDTASWKPLGTIGPQHARISQLQFAEDGSLLVSGDWDGAIRRWDALTPAPIGLPLIQQRGLVESLALHRDKRFLAAGYSNGAVLWDLAATPPVASPLPVLQSRRVNAVAFADDGATLLAVEGTGKLVSWSFAAGALSNRHQVTLGERISALAAHGNTIAAGLENGTIVWLRTPGLTEIRRTAAHPHAFILSLAFDGKGERLASGASDSSVRV